MAGPFKMKGFSPFSKTEKKVSGDDVLKKRFGTGWKDAQAAGYTVVDGKVISPKSEDVSNPLKEQ